VREPKGVRKGKGQVACCVSEIGLAVFALDLYAD